MRVHRIAAWSSVVLLCCGSLTCVGEDSADGMELNCGNDLDDDGDGLRDCNDPDCLFSPSCSLYCDFDGFCGVGENNNNCPSDCPTPLCGNGACETGESSSSCAADCGDSRCGNGTCDADETAASCPADCTSHAFCGNSVCEVGESHESCPSDCAAAPVCGDGLISGSEACDGANLGTATCVSLGFDSGTLACLADCSAYDTSGCAGGAFQCIDVLTYEPPDFPPCDAPNQTACQCEGCVTDGVCFDADLGLIDDCVCPDCATDSMCSDASRCINDGECNPYGEGCVCADCALHPMCQ